MDQEEQEHESGRPIK